MYVAEWILSACIEIERLFGPYSEKYEYDPNIVWAFKTSAQMQS